MLNRTIRLAPTALGLLLLASCSDTVDVTSVSGRLEPMDVDFGKVQVGIAMPYTLVVKNIGTGSLNVSAVEIGENFTAAAYDFKIADASAFALGASNEKNIVLSFQPFEAMDAPVESFIRLVTDAKDSAGMAINYTIRLKGQGILSGLEVVPNPVDFGTVLVGSSHTLDVTIKNTLSVDVDVISRLDDQGRPQIINQAGLGRFEIVSPVQPNGSILAAGTLLAKDQTVTIQARYVPDPSQEGREDRGKWTIANCDNSLCDIPVIMLGKGTNAAIECTPSPIDFGDVNPGVTQTQRTTCKNVASETVTVTGWRLDAGSASEFVVLPYNGTPSSLAAGAEFTVETQFSPQLGSVGQTLQGNLVINGRNPRANRDLTPARIPITGRAGGPDIAVLPPRLDFGQVAIGTTSKKRIIVQNEGFSDLTVRMITPDADGTGAFTVDRTAFAVARGATEIIEVTFRPSAPPAAVMSRLIIASDDTDEPSVEVPLQGVGIELPPCSYTINPTELNFGITQVLRSSTQGVRIENTGTNACLVNDVEIAAGSSPAYSLPNGAETGIMIPPGQSHTILVQFLPPGEGVIEGTLTFYISNPTNSNPTVPLRGVGSASALLITPNELDFGKIGLDCSTRERTITIYNTGANVTRILRIERPMGVSPEFEVLNLPTGIPSPPGAGRNIPAGQSIEFGVRYHAADIGADSGFLHVFEQGRTDPYVIPVFGEGATDPTNEDTFRQLDTPQVDVLFVIDNSCSMSEEQTSLVGNFASFIQFADAQALDYRLAVVSTDIEGFGGVGGNGCPSPAVAMRPNGTPQGACGYFADGNPMVANPDWRLVTPDEQPSAEGAFTALVGQGINGSGNEQGLAAAYQALSAPLITGWNTGFLRPDAYLAIIFVTDEEDYSTGSVDFYANFFKSIKGFRNTNLFSASVIGGDANTGCNGPGGNADAGDRYVAVANATGGIFESICTASWATALQNLGLNVFGYKSRFFLSNTPVAGTVEVLVDGVRIDRQAMSGQVRWAYDGNTNSLNFAPLAIPEPGSEIIVRYVAECL